MNLSRREFLGATAALGLTPIPSILLRAAERLSAAGDDRALVVLQLSGGNDGLNTVIPFEESDYHNGRPTLAVGKGQALPLGPLDGQGSASGGGAGGGPAVGLHPRMKALHDLYREGKVAVIQGVGYPNPSRSHFRSMDIWHTARPETEGVETGWLGAAVARERSLRGLIVGEERPPLALQGETPVPTLQNLDWIEYLAQEGGAALRRRLHALHARERTGEVEHVRGLAAATLDELEKVIELYRRPVPVTYPESHLADKLRWVGQLIGGGFGSRIYYLTFSGFDTHAQQRDAHGQLLGSLSDAVAAFHRHLAALGKSDRAALMIFSEFGRRVRENGSLGTDHGCAGPVLVVSGAVRGGLHGPHPSLADLDQGDLRYHTDFRRVYASLLEDVLGMGSESVLGGKFEKLRLFSRVARV